MEQDYAVMAINRVPAYVSAVSPDGKE